MGGLSECPAPAVFEAAVVFYEAVEVLDLQASAVPFFSRRESRRGCAGRCRGFRRGWLGCLGSSVLGRWWRRRVLCVGIFCCGCGFWRWF